LACGVVASRFWRCCRFDRKNDNEMPRDQYSDLRRAYAVAAGVTARTAQRHERARHPDWLKFIGATAAEGVKRRERDGAMAASEATALAAVSPSRPEETPQFYAVPDSELSVVQLHEKRAWQIHDQTFRTWQEMLVEMKSDPVMALGFARELPRLREDYEKARAAREKWELEQRRLIPLHEFEAFVGQFMVPIGELLKNLPVELPVLMNPEAPGLARDRLIEWLRDKAAPQIEEMLGGAGEMGMAR
jgi:hypothetical protein